MARYRRLFWKDVEGTKLLLSSGRLKGKSHLKRRWQPAEVQAVERHMQRFIAAAVVPNKSDCDQCLRAEPEALADRDWRHIKFYVHNQFKKKGTTS